MADFGVRFRLVQDEVSPLFAEIAERAGEAKPVLRQWGAFLKAGARQAFVDKAPPLAASTLEKQTRTGTSAVTGHGKVRAAYAGQLDHKLRRSGSDEARQELRRVLSGDLTRSAQGNRTVDRLRRRLAQAQAARAQGIKIATGKSIAERRGGQRGGKLANAFKVDVRGLSVKVLNMARYSLIHDEGGTVGNGAKLPPWNFMQISDGGAERLADIALAWLLDGRK